MIAKKSLQEAPKRLQRMLLRLQQYDVTINYRQGKNMHIADTLSRAYLPETSETEENLEVLRFHEELENINMVQNLPVSDEAKNAIRVETSNDEDLQSLVQVVQKGWPEMKAALPAPVKQYFQLRDELSVQDGVLFRGNRVIIPRSMRADTLKKIHQSHIGINGCLRRARECLYWPSMSSEVKNYISRCTTCRSLDQKQQKETIKFHDVPSRPWAKVGADVFAEWERLLSDSRLL